MKTRTLLLFGMGLLGLVSPLRADENADSLYEQGMALQRRNRTPEAIAVYRQALSLNPNHARSHYEIGWSYWTLRQWDQVISHWERARHLKAPYPELPDFLRTARQNAAGTGEPVVRVPIGTSRASHNISPPDSHNGKTSGVRLTLIARFQHYNPTPTDPADHYDPYIFSPKSVQFSADGRKAYVNALEGYATVIYDAQNLKQIGRVVHRFDARHAGLFESSPSGPPWARYLADRTPAQPNHFSGKPVESALSHDGRYLWVPYYRRDFDQFGVLPSAVAVIDTGTDKIVRILDTGPIPKYVTASPDGNWVAITHWGDNTVGLIDTSGQKPETYRRAMLLEIGRPPNLSAIASTDRDHQCGLCLRGTVFTPDSQHLLVGRMGGDGGVSVVDIKQRKVIGTVQGMRPTPRHLALSPDGDQLYMSSSLSGYVSRYHTQEFIAAAHAKKSVLKPLQEGESGPATRTIALSPNGRFVFAAANLESRLVVLDAESLKVLTWIPADSYPVGLAVTPDGKQVWVTSQGRDRRGGNSLSIYQIEDL